MESRAICRGLTGVVVAFFLLVTLWVKPAEAYAWMIRHDYTGCNQCHADSSGGGLLTEYGRAQSDFLLRMRYGAPESYEPPRSAEFLLGVVKLPESLLLGGDVRLCGVGTRVNGQDSSRFFFMQADLQGQLAVERVKVNGSIGYAEVGAPPSRADPRRREKPRFARPLGRRRHRRGPQLAAAGRPHEHAVRHSRRRAHALGALLDAHRYRLFAAARGFACLQRGRPPRRNHADRRQFSGRPRRVSRAGLQRLSRIRRVAAPRLRRLEPGGTRLEGRRFADSRSCATPTASSAATIRSSRSSCWPKRICWRMRRKAPPRARDTSACCRPIRRSRRDCISWRPESF